LLHHSSWTFLSNAGAALGFTFGMRPLQHCLKDNGNSYIAIVNLEPRSRTVGLLRVLQSLQEKQSLPLL